MTRCTDRGAGFGGWVAVALTGLALHAAIAEVPTGDPTFSDPTEFTNDFMPFEVGAVKVFAGRSEGARTAVVDLYRSGTREFLLDGTPVTCRILQETEFEDGELIEVSVNYFACSDDGSVWYFGETVDEYEDGEIIGHGGSWLVGGPGAEDPEETDEVDTPALFMPGDPEVGDTFRPEDVPDGPQEEAEIARVDRKVRVTAGTFTGCIQVDETNLADGEEETKWYAPGVGVIKAKAKREILKLVASSLLSSDED